VKRFVASRLLQVIPQLVIVAIVTFVLLRLLPANPVTQIVGPTGTQATYAIEKQKLGLSASLLSQLGTFFGNILHGSFGTSWQTNLPVRAEIGQHLPITLQLIVMATAVALLIGIPLGYLLSTGSSAGRGRGRGSRRSSRWGWRPARGRGSGQGRGTQRRSQHRFLRIFSLFAGSQPDFWWGLVFIYLFFYLVRIFPAPLGILSLTATPPRTITGFVLIDSLLTGQVGTFFDALDHFALPVLTLAFVVVGPIIRMTSQGMRTEVNADYVLYARAAGLSRLRIALYIVRNGLAPVLTLTGVLFGVLLGGAVLVETVFSLNGLGVYTLQSVLALNYPSIEGSVVVMTAIALLVYIVMDILYALLDPRVRNR
jgi:ABC-type dipeptide/oligopeptide/nickel transport system permease component